MVGSQQELLDYIAKDIKKNEGIYYPIKASLYEQFFVKKLPVTKLHPNPDDEFSMPSIGPNFRIINEYREQIRDAIANCDKLFEEQLIVEKIEPDGYMIINGHHRWSAAMLDRVKKVPVNIVNLTHDEDLHHMLDTSTRNKRVAMDLDEVIFTTDDKAVTEKKLSLFGKVFFKEKLLIGRPALINALHKAGFDVWVYTRGYHSTDYIERFFKRYNVKVDGIINGIGRNDPRHTDGIKEKFEQKYTLSLHIALDQISYIDKATREFKTLKINSDEKGWSKEVMSLIDSLGGEKVNE